MDNQLFQSYSIEERSYVSFIKREIHNLVRPHFNENRTGEIDIVVSEMCSNIINHARSGELLYRLQHTDETPIFEVICIDNAEGMHDTTHNLQDGISTKNTLGQGLGAINRLSNFSQVYSLPKWGTIVYAKFYNTTGYKLPKEKVTVRYLNVAKPGENVSGDKIAFKSAKDKMIFIACDGLGHGKQAKEAVDKATKVFYETHTKDPSELIKEINEGVKKTRGLVATVATLDYETKEWKICGVGNIHAQLQMGLENKNYIGNNGIIGLNIPNRLENAVLKMEKFQLLILCSDGMKTRWDLIKYPSILKFDPIIIASIIYKDYARKTDDMSILIAKVIA